MKKSRVFFKIMLAAVCVLAAGILATAAVNLAVVLYAKKYIVTPAEASRLNADCILVPGAAVLPNGNPSYMLEDRILGAIELYENGTSDKILMSGDHGTEFYNEVGCMKEYSVDKGVPADNIILDHAGFSTYETMYRAREIFCVNKAVAVTQKYHLSRAVFTARRLGIEMYGVCSDPRSYGDMSHDYIREYFARVKAFIWCIFKPEPTYLGETFPILSVDGSDTDDVNKQIIPVKESTTAAYAEVTHRTTVTEIAQAAGKNSSTAFSSTTSKTNLPVDSSTTRTTSPAETEDEKQYPIYTTYLNEATTLLTLPHSGTTQPVTQDSLITGRPSAVNTSWPDDEFFASVPKAPVRPSKVSSYKNNKGQNVNIQFSSLTYEQYLSYISSLEAAGFKDNNSRANVPDKAPESVAMFYSSNKGLCFGVYWYPPTSAAGIACQINATDYDPTVA